MRYTDARSNCFLTFFDCLAYVAGVFLCLKHRVEPGSTEHCPGSLYRHIFFGISTPPTCFRVSCSQLSEQWHPREMHSRQRTLPGTTVNPVHGLYPKLNKHFLSFIPDTLLVSSFACDFFHNDVNVPTCLCLHFFDNLSAFSFLFSSLFVFRRLSAIQCLSGHPSVKGG
jgi:hypothetical protein